jgi:dihydrofolate reductase
MGPFEGLGQDIVEGIRRIRSQDGPNLILWGSSTLTSTLIEHGFADEALLAVYPDLLGTGKTFFAEGYPARSFELVSTTATPSGIVLSSDKLAGPLKTGDGSTSRLTVDRERDHEHEAEEHDLPLVRQRRA